jgi:hypothetical protein
MIPRILIPLSLTYLNPFGVRASRVINSKTVGQFYEGQVKLKSCKLFDGSHSFIRNALPHRIEIFFPQGRQNKIFGVMELKKQTTTRSNGAPGGKQLHFGRQLLDFAKKHNFWDFAKKIKF